MQTITVDIINEKVMLLLKELEKLKLIRVRRDVAINKSANTSLSRYKGALSKQSKSEVDKQLDELRGGWE